jgi:predicted acyl esterase
MEGLRQLASAQNTPKALYFQTDGKLSFDAPRSDDKTGFDSYVSDPANPVPYLKRPIQATYDPKGSGWYTWLVEDQRFVADRKDVAKWQTDVLIDNVTLSGDMIAHLFASTTGTDSDWVVKLIDVYPDTDTKNLNVRYQLMVADEIFRRYRKSFENRKRSRQTKCPTTDRPARKRSYL